MTAEIKVLHGADAEGRYRLLVDAIIDYAIYMIDPNGHITSWNTGANRFKGYTEEEILGEHFSRFYTPEDRESGVPNRTLETAAAEGRYEAEGWRVRKDGTRFWAHVILDAIRDLDGQLLGFAKITRDLTERKQAEEVLKRSEEQFRLLVQGVADYAIYMLDPTGLVSSWNLGAQRIKGYDPEEIIGKHFSQFYTEEDRVIDLPATALEIAAREGRFEREGWRLRKDGSRFWANVIIDSIRSDSNELIGFAKVTRDITEKREAQQALEHAQQELFQAQKMEAVGQLTGGIAHDFNNLLTAVLGSLEIAKKRDARGERVGDLIDNAIQGARRGAALTQRLLAFSRKQDLALEAVDVAGLVRGMADLLQRSIGPAIEIQTSFPLVIPNVSSDPNQLESALLNLIVNARDAMPNGGTISISSRKVRAQENEIAELAAGDYVCLEIRDEGEGMDQETLVSATTPFFTTKGTGKGTGLGLPMVQGVMAQSGGKLVLKSVKGEGTTAELWLPVFKDLCSVVEENDEEIQLPPNLGRPLLILTVDDDPLVLANTALMIDDLGHSAITAESAEEALKILQREEGIDLVITDHAMPKMTGAQLVAEIRQQWRDLPIVLATGYAEIPDETRVDVYRLSKPYSQTELLLALAKATREPSS